MARDLAALAPDLARAPRAVVRVSRSAVTGPQRAAAMVAADRWTARAVAAGWTQSEIAAALHVHPSAVSSRVTRQRRREPDMPAPSGVLDVPTAPSTERELSEQRRRRLIGAAEVARLVGCQPASVPSWAAARDVTAEWTPGHGKRLYDRDQATGAAGRHPLQTHPTRPRRKNIAISPQDREPGGSTVRLP